MRLRAELPLPPEPELQHPALDSLQLPSEVESVQSVLHRCLQLSQPVAGLRLVLLELFQPGEHVDLFVLTIIERSGAGAAAGAAPAAAGATTTAAPAAAAVVLCFSVCCCFCFCFWVGVRLVVAAVVLGRVAPVVVAGIGAVVAVAVPVAAASVSFVVVVDVAAVGVAVVGVSMFPFASLRGTSPRDGVEGSVQARDEGSWRGSGGLCIHLPS
mmetsp:Transcript_51639/g.112205  ORF Transcript_51639/g.112205 Transcript_51639/m.112205 type:complete len:213 (+) Transcript_51639:500-1138(+)